MVQSNDPGTVAGRVAQAVAFFKSKGEGNVQTAAWLSDIFDESGFDPTNPNPREGAIGYFQDEGGRRLGLQAYAAAHGTTETDPMAQLGFAWEEYTSSAYSTIHSELEHATDPAQAGYLLGRDFERAAAYTWPAHGAHAASAYADLQAGRIPKVGLPAGFSGGGGGGQNDQKSAPYDPATLHVPLTKVQRANMIKWLWVRSVGPEGTAVTGIPSPADMAKMPDKQLLDLYTVQWRLAGVTGAPITSPIAVWGDIQKWLESLGKYVIDGLVILLGAIMVIVAFVLFAKATGNDVSISNPRASTPPLEHGKHDDEDQGADVEAAAE